MGYKDFFNALAEHWDDMTRADKGKLQRIITHVALKQGQRVLDVGTGTGIMIPFLYKGLQNGGEIVAVDLAENMLQRAREKYGSMANFVPADAGALPFPEETFDRILCYSVFPHFQDKRQVLRELARVLKQSGQIIVAHSESREQVNAFHQSLKGLVAKDQIPEDAVMRELADQAGLQLQFVEHNDQLYVVKYVK
mgnify:CR=1 FL=1